jgi:acetoin:2,6-dichlorophenolindophenol oxidoreductase subunit beta
MQQDERVVLLGEDIGTFGGIFQVTAGLQKEFGPGRVVDTPISEQGFVGASVGAALTGMRPVAEIMFMDFTTACMDQLVNQAAKMHYMFGAQGKVPMVVRTTSGAGRSAAAQHSQSLHAWFMHIPGLQVVMPSTPYDAKGLMIEAIHNDNPVIFVEHKKLYYEKGPVPEEMYSIPFGKADIKREGTDITVVATHLMVQHALKVAEDLAREGIELEVVDLRTISPLDKMALLTSVKKTGRLLVADEGHKTCGVGAEFATIVAEEAIEYLKAPVARVAMADTPVPFSPPLENACVPGPDDLLAAVRRLMQYA